MARIPDGTYVSSNNNEEYIVSNNGIFQLWRDDGIILNEYKQSIENGILILYKSCPHLEYFHLPISFDRHGGFTTDNIHYIKSKPKVKIDEQQTDLCYTAAFFISGIGHGLTSDGERRYNVVRITDVCDLVPLSLNHTRKTYAFLDVIRRYGLDVSNAYFFSIGKVKKERYEVVQSDRECHQVLTIEKHSLCHVNHINDFENYTPTISQEIVIPHKLRLYVDTDLLNSFSRKIKVAGFMGQYFEWEND